MAFLTSLLRKREQPGGAVSQLICIVHKTVLNDPCPWTKAPGPVSFAAFLRLIAAVLDRRPLAKPLTVKACRVGLGQSRKPRLRCLHEPGGHSHSIFGDGGGHGFAQTKAPLLPSGAPRTRQVLQSGRARPMALVNQISQALVTV
jgi:hypothetical protein